VIDELFEEQGLGVEEPHSSGGCLCRTIVKLQATEQIQSWHIARPLFEGQCCGGVFRPNSCFDGCGWCGQLQNARQIRTGMD
jgi:hypothetical protein